MLRAALTVLFAAITFALIGACHEPPGYPETGCNAQCNARATQCSEDDCERGCRFVLDRLVEHEGPNVVACVSKTIPTLGCGDPIWAECAARVGMHADGGPPPPVHAVED